MQTFRCVCGNQVYFDNSCCLACQRELGWCEACSRMTALMPNGQADRTVMVDFCCGHADCARSLRKCHNYAVENVCNRCYSLEPDGATNNSAPKDVRGAAPQLCLACQMTKTIPDLTVLGNREKWARLEAAKRRLLYTLDRLGLPYADVEPNLTFDFKADVERPSNEWRNAGTAEIVYTGHAAGNITINIREADDAVRESLRCQFHEAQRTLIGHFHHEMGHYYWERLVQNRREDEFRKLFGDHNSSTYAESMSAYYQYGPRPGWFQSHISAYAAAHPWEDFAETFALYLDMAAVLDTATQLFMSIDADFRGPSVAPLVERYQEVGVLVNEFNRTVGLFDLVPEVVVRPVVAKLDFIHALVIDAARSGPWQPSPEPSVVRKLDQTQQDT
ncbi:MAG: putative zinc-binding metallopeptidase [Pirellulales bacterium]